MYNKTNHPDMHTIHTMCTFHAHEPAIFPYLHKPFIQLQFVSPCCCWWLWWNIITCWATTPDADEAAPAAFIAAVKGKSGQACI